MNNAYLLQSDGTVIEVLNHPNANFEFDSILYVLSEYGNEFAKSLVAEYNTQPSEYVKEQILAIYDNNWCKVREWDNGNLVTFRITSTNSFNWYNIIVDFLLDNPRYKRSKITVESDKRTGVRKVFWDEISYTEAISPEFDTIMATKATDDLVYL